MSENKPRLTQVTITPELEKWITMFKAKAKGEHGFEPTLGQCMTAFVAKALDALRREG